MCQNHPGLREALARARTDELRQSAEANANANSRRDKPRHRPIQAARRGTGWLLVDMGLRLAVPRNAPHQSRSA
jgi:hypothetical protein